MDFNIEKKLYALQQTGRFVDVAFVIPLEGEQIKVVAHKCVMSTMMKERWNLEDLITVPEKISLVAVVLFVKVSGFCFKILFYFVIFIFLLFYFAVFIRWRA